MTKAQQKERSEAIEQLRQWIKPGDTVYTILDSVSRSGMTRHIRCLIPTVEQQACDCHTYTDAAPHFVGAPKVSFVHPNYSIAQALGMRQAKSGSLIVSGCGMDMGFHLVYNLSSVLYGSGYDCLGKGRCPSNYHINHRDHIRCEGVYDGENRRHCFKPDPFCRWPIAEDWPRGTASAIGMEDGVEMTIPGKHLACVATREDDGVYEVCPTCRGEGYLPNPDGPERFDLTHTDGYALRHEWL